MQVAILRTDDIATCRAIRQTVFVEEQQVTPEDEWDDLDGEAMHYLLTFEGKPVGTARLRIVDGIAKIERVALLKETRGKGLGAQLMRHVMCEARTLPGVTYAKLGAQVQALRFYETLGFEAVSEVYDDAGIPHRWMRAAL